MFVILTQNRHVKVFHLSDISWPGQASVLTSAQTQRSPQRGLQRPQETALKRSPLIVRYIIKEILIKQFVMLIVMFLY